MGLTTTFAIAPASRADASTKADKLAQSVHSDPVARHLVAAGIVRATERDGRLHLECPWKSEHSSDNTSETTYWPRHTGGYERGHFKCLHSHGDLKTDDDFLQAIGYVDTELLDKFEVAEAVPGERARFSATPIAELRDRPLAAYHIKGVLPRAALVVIYGEPGSGKSFIAWDMALAVAQGATWRGKRVKQGRVVYIVAEGREGLPARIMAYESHFGVDLSALSFRCIERDTPSLMDGAQTLELCERIRAEGGADLVVVDTLSQVMAGGDENSSDMAVISRHCNGIARATGGTVVLIHHSGKDPTRGARGHSSLKGAVDAELEVLKAGSERSISTTKMKDGPDGDAYGFRLISVEIGRDEDGDPITSCVCVHNESGRVARRSEVKGAVERVVLSVLKLGADAAMPQGELIEGTVAQIPFDPKGGKRDTRRQRVLRAVEKMCAERYLTVADGNISFRGD